MTGIPSLRCGGWDFGVWGFSARRASLTSYAVFLAQFCKSLAGRASSALGNVLQPLAKTFFWINLGSEVEQALLGSEGFGGGVGWVLSGSDELSG